VVWYTSLYYLKTDGPTPTQNYERVGLFVVVAAKLVGRYRIGGNELCLCACYATRWNVLFAQVYYIRKLSAHNKFEM